RQLFRVGTSFQYRLRGDLHSLFRERVSTQVVGPLGRFTDRPLLLLLNDPSFRSRLIAPAATPTFIPRAKHARSPLVATENAGMHASQPGLLGVMILPEPPFDFLR